MTCAKTTVVPWIFLFFIGFSASAGAEVYRFVDKDGVVHFTNVPNDSRYQPIDAKPGRRGQQKKTRIKAPYQQKRIAEDSYDDHIAEAAKRFNIPAALIRAVISCESNFNPRAVSNAGAQGLMQLMPETATEMGVVDPFDPRQNILGGTRYLRKLANMFDGDLVLTLAGYNAGHKAVTRHMDIPPFAETQRYVRRVLQLYYHFKKESGGGAAAKQAKRSDDGGRAE